MLVAVQDLPPSVMIKQGIIHPVMALRVWDCVRDHNSERKIVKEQICFKETSLISMASLLSVMLRPKQVLIQMTDMFDRLF